MKKYDLVKDVESGLYRVVALRDFRNVYTGDVGGFVSGEHNLSHDGDCWISGQARVIDGAVVKEDATIRDSAEVRDAALVAGHATVRDSASVYNHAMVGGGAIIDGRSHVFDSAEVSGDAALYGEAKVYGDAVICYGLLDVDMFSDMRKYIAASLNIYPIDNKYILYKKVNATYEAGVYRSLHDPSFLYKDGEVAEVLNACEDVMKVCTSGLHVSHSSYWKEGNTLLAVEVDMADIITCMSGKIRCRRLKVIGPIYYSVVPYI